MIFAVKKKTGVFQLKIMFRHIFWLAVLAVFTHKIPLPIA